jgi:hypothetical protein
MVIMRLRSSALFRVLMTWHNKVFERVRMRNGLTKIRCMWVHRATSKYFSIWEGNGANIRRMRIFLHIRTMRIRVMKVHTRLKLSLLVKAFSKWYADSDNEAKEERMRRRAMLIYGVNFQ